MLRCATDMLIHVPVSDAFSASMLERVRRGSDYRRLVRSELRRHRLALAGLGADDPTAVGSAWTISTQSRAARTPSPNQTLVHPPRPSGPDRHLRRGPRDEHLRAAS
jgi:hypothetical protein